MIYHHNIFIHSKKFPIAFIGDEPRVECYPRPQPVTQERKKKTNKSRLTLNCPINI